MCCVFFGIVKLSLFFCNHSLNSYSSLVFYFFGRMTRVILCEVIVDKAEKALVDQRMDELHELVWTYGWLTVAHVVQQRTVPDYRYFVGKGKLEEIKTMMHELDAQLLIIGNIMKPSQIYQVNEYLRKDGFQARDRVDLILKIFDRHATSMEARLQIELAAIKHMWPRIFGMGMELSRQGWGKGNVRGIGETNTERMRRHLAERKANIVKQLRGYEQVRATHRSARKKHALPTIWLIGYTNAGKSTLMNALTHKGVLVENKLFATLWTSVGKLWIEQHDGYGKEFLINDTIGFIRELPPDLIDAFRSTLEDSVEADLLLHLIDASDDLVDDKIHVVNNILDTIWAKQPRVLVFNKIDRLTKKQRSVLKKTYGKNALYLSAVSGEGIEELKEKIGGMVS